MNKNILEETNVEKAINNHINEVISQNDGLSFDILIENVYKAAGVEVASIAVILRGIIEDLTDRINSFDQQLLSLGLVSDSTRHALLNNNVIQKEDIEFAVTQVKFIGEILEQDENKQLLLEGKLSPEEITERAKRMATVLFEKQNEKGASNE